MVCTILFITTFSNSNVELWTELLVHLLDTRWVYDIMIRSPITGAPTTVRFVCVGLSVCYQSSAIVRRLHNNRSSEGFQMFSFPRYGTVKGAILKTLNFQCDGTKTSAKSRSLRVGRGRQHKRRLTCRAPWCSYYSSGQIKVNVSLRKNARGSVSSLYFYGLCTMLPRLPTQ